MYSINKEVQVVRKHNNLAKSNSMRNYQKVQAIWKN